jgi:hypothetical protein
MASNTMSWNPALGFDSAFEMGMLDLNFSDPVFSTPAPDLSKRPKGTESAFTSGDIMGAVSGLGQITAATMGGKEGQALMTGVQGGLYGYQIGSAAGSIYAGLTAGAVEGAAGAAGGAATGAEAGSSFGPWGAVIGAVVGLVVGAVTGSKEEEAMEEQQELMFLQAVDESRRMKKANRYQESMQRAVLGASGVSMGSGTAKLQQETAKKQHAKQENQFLYMAAKQIGM